MHKNAYLKIIFVLVSIMAVINLTPNILTAAQYYISTSGNDNASGKTPQEAWQTIDKLNSFNFQAGDDVFFKCGDYWSTNNRFFVNWSGSEKNPVVIGSYYVDNNEAVHGFNGKYPIVSGDVKWPSDNYNGLIQSNQQSYVTVKNIKLIDSNGHGLFFFECENANAENIYVDGTYRAGIIFWRCNTSGESLVTNSIVTNFCKEYTRGDWNAGIVCVNTKNVTVSNNKVFEGFGEGIHIGSIESNNISENAIIEKNIVYDNRAAQIYLYNAKHNIVRYNFVFGTHDSNVNTRFIEDGVNYAGAGIYVCDESKWNSGPHFGQIQVYGNTVFNCIKGLNIQFNYDETLLKDSLFINNSFVDNYTGIYITGWRASNTTINNNIIYDINNNDTLYKGLHGINGVNFDYNLWSKSVPEGIQGPHDPDPTTYIYKSNKLLSYGKDLDVTQFDLVDGCAAVDSGKTFSSIFSNAINAINSTFKNHINISFLNQNDCGTGWDIGGDIHCTSSSIEVLPPTELNLEQID